MESATIRAKPLRPIRQDPIHAALLEIIDGGLHGRMLPAHLPERRVGDPFPVGRTEFSLLRQHVVIQQFVQCDPVGGTVEPPIEAAQAEVGEAGLGFPDHGHGMIHVSAFPQDPGV